MSENETVMDRNPIDVGRIFKVDAALMVADVGDAMSVFDALVEAGVIPSLGQMAHPTVTVYPECAQCGDAYVLKRAISAATGDYAWAWFAGCPKSHKKGPGPHHVMRPMPGFESMLPEVGA